MNTISINSKDAKMIAHRGVSGLEPENTCASFLAAGNRSYFGIETDVHITKDGKVAVVHDDNMLRVSGVDLIVEESTLDALQAIPLYDKSPEAFRTDLRVPSLYDYISICKRYDKTAVLELKNQMHRDNIEKIVNIIQEMNYLENVIFISFSWENLVHLRSFLPEQPLQFLTRIYEPSLIDKLKNYHFDLDIHYQAVTKDLVELLHKNGITINCYTVDDKECADKLIDWGVDYITSNILE